MRNIEFKIRLSEEEHERLKEAAGEVGCSSPTTSASALSGRRAGLRPTFALASSPAEALNMRSRISLHQVLVRDPGSPIKLKCVNIPSRRSHFTSFNGLRRQRSNPARWSAPGYWPVVETRAYPMIMPYHDKNLPKPQTFCHGFLERLTV